MENCDDAAIPNTKRRAATNASLNIAKKQASNLKRVSSLLRKKRAYKPLSEEQEKFLQANSELVKQFYKRREKRTELLNRQNECEDSPNILEEKCQKLAQAIHDSEFLIVYTGAGISTAASIPDYRGPNGIWTRLQKGKDIGHHDLTTAEPTFTHMALAHLHSKGVVRHVVSQNCDGLHLRSGLPKTSISEVHGNMYIEVCKHCVPAREYVRTIDVTEKTSTFKHTTGRRCYRCGEPLVDTIVHFGERGKLRWPLNWQGACQAAKACDTILCLGSSLKVLRKYTWLWQTHRPLKRRPKLYIVNLQWTPKDKDATLKINGKCDDVMRLVMNKLGLEVPLYKKVDDPIFQVSTPLHIDEISTITRPPIEPPIDSPDQMVPLSQDIDKMNFFLNNYRSVFDNLPLGLSANDLMATLSKLEDIKDEKDKFGSEIYEKLKIEVPSDEEVKEEIKGLKVEVDTEKVIKLEEVKLEVDKEVKTETEESKVDLEKGLDIKIEESIPNFLVEKLCDNYKNRAKVDLLEEVKLEAFDDEEEEIFSDKSKTESSSNFKNKVIKNVDEIHQTSDLRKDQKRLKEDEDEGKLIAEVGTELKSIPHELNLNESSIFMNGDFLNVPPQSVLKDLANRYSSNFYGTGLCIRSTSHSLRDEEDDGDDDDDDNDDIASLSSVPSENSSDNQLEDKNGENTADFLLVSENASCLKGDESLTEKNKCSASATIRSSQEVITYQIANANSDKENHCVRNIDGDHFSSFSSEVSFDECSMEFPFKKGDCMPLSFESDGVPLHVLFSEDDNCKQDGSFILHTKVIDGIIHETDVKVNSMNSLLKEEPKSELLLNADENNFVTKDNSDPELKALWYNKFCDKNLRAEQKIKKKKPSFELDDDVKSLWFWGFDNHQKKEKHPQKRLTRSSYQKALSNLDPESVGLICNCLFSNPQLCHLAMLRSEHLQQQQEILEEEMIRARDAFRKRRHTNYKKHEPVFQVSLKSFTYERRKIRRSRKEEVYEDEDEQAPLGEESETGGDTHRKNDEIKVTPGWYGKGYRKILKKKKNYL